MTTKQIQLALGAALLGLCALTAKWINERQGVTATDEFEEGTHSPGASVAMLVLAAGAYGIWRFGEWHRTQQSQADRVAELEKEQQRLRAQLAQRDETRTAPGRDGGTG